MGLTTLAEEVTERFNGFEVGTGDYVVELLAPEGQLHHLRLRPRRPGFSVIVAGTVNPIEKHAELRSFEHASLVHQIRFAKMFEITPPEWEQLLRRAEDVLRIANIETARVGPSPDLLREARQKKSGRRISPGALAVFLIVLLLAAAVSVRVVQILMAGRAGR